MQGHGYKKYMKKNTGKDYSLIKLFALSFFGMLLFFTMLIKSFSPSVDVSIGEYKEADAETQEEIQRGIDDRLSRIQDEDNGRTFEDLMKKAEDVEQAPSYSDEIKESSPEKPAPKPKDDVSEALKTPAADPIYKVFIGSYSSSEQAKVAKDIIQESGTNLNPIVKCIGSNNYTLQVGIFKNKKSADALLESVKASHLPGRIVQDY